MEPSMLLGAVLALLVFGFLAFQNRIIAALMGRRDPNYAELLEEP